MPPYIGTNGNDSYWGGPDADHIQGLGGRDYLNGNGGDDQIFGGDGADTLNGGEGNDLLEGGEGDDSLQGNEGADIVRGMGGNDRILLDTQGISTIAGDSIDGGGGIDTLQFDGLFLSTNITFSIANPAIVQILAGATVVNMEQLSFRSGSGNDDITGGALNDYIDGHDGNDRIDGGLGNDNLDGGFGTDTIYGGGGNDTIRGGSGGINDILYGGDGDDTFHRNQDALIDGGAGLDEIRFEYYGSTGATADLSNPNVETNVLGTRVIGIERLWFIAGSGNDRLTGGIGDDLLGGNDGDDILIGGPGNDRLSGGDGNDQLSGGAGDDSLHNDTSDVNPGDLIDGGDGFDTLTFWAPNATAPITIDLLATTGLVTNVERIQFLGGSGTNTVSGGAAEDTLWGGIGGDHFDGRGGDDDIRANGGDDVVIGGSGNDYLEGGEGADTLSGGDGDDLLSGNEGNDNLDGGDGSDDLSGGDGDDTLRGGAGNDRLTGTSGYDGATANDVYDGGEGIDRIDLFTSTGLGVTVDLRVATAQNTGSMGIDTFIGIENITATNGNDTLTGDDGANWFVTFTGSDLLSGNGGNDWFTVGNGDKVVDGGAGSDTITYSYTYDQSLYTEAGITVSLALQGTAQATGVGNWTLTNMENLGGSWGADRLTGDVNANILAGSGGDDTLAGGAGDDILAGDGAFIAYNDTLILSADATWEGGNDVLDGGDGDDVIYGGGGGDNLSGGDGNDDLFTGAGESDGYASFNINFPEYYHAPTLDRGAEVDIVSGGAGDDFVSVGYGDSADGGAHGEQGDELFISVAAAPTGVQLDFRNQTLNIGGGTITGFERVNFVEGSGFADTIIFDAVPFPLSPGFGGSGGGREISALGGDDQVIAGYYTENVWGGDGNDLLDGSASQYLGYLDGGSGSDTLIGNRFATVFNGGEGDDTISGGGGADRVTGGAGNDLFRGTSADLNGDIITDFSGGDRIVISNVSLASFSFSVSGTTLTYTGGSLTLGAFSGRQLFAREAAGGGVELSHGDVRNDFNGDGRSDILWRASNGTVTDWLGTANGGFAGNFGNANLALTNDWQIAGTGDFNGDGRSDILWRASNGTVTDWLGQANGGFAGNFGNANLALTNDWQIAGTGDFNGDGRDDILWRASNGTVTDWLGQANGGFAGNFGNANLALTNDWQVAGTGDFNGDGRDDILWRASDGTVTDWLGTANGGFIGNFGNANLTLTNDWQIAGTGDFNGDGRDDILWRATNGTVTNWLGQADGGFVGNFGNANLALTNDWQIAGTGDYDGDGRDDVLWRASNGTVTDWLGTATGGFTGNFGNANLALTNDWQIQPGGDLF